MSMKKDELCKLKIEIQTNNLFRYREIAVLVDKPKFLERVKKVRKEIGITELLPFRPLRWQVDSMKWSTSNSKKEQHLVKAAKKLSEEFQIPKYMVNNVYQALLFGIITDKDPTVGIVHPKSVVERPYVAIFPTLSTTDKDILSALKEAKRILKGDSIISHSFGFKSDALNKIAPHKVKQHREWYWRNLAGESYTDIAFSLKSKKFQDEYIKRKLDHIEGTSRYLIGKQLTKVAQAIGRYSDALAE
jgi:hypothetical protein